MDKLVLKNFADKCSASNRQKGQDRPFHRRIGIQLTQACPVSCKHCLLSCRADGIDISLSHLSLALREWKDFPNSEGVGFTGGEPFYRMNLLRDATEIALSLGLSVRVATSAFWATSLRSAINCLKLIPGLTTLVISVDRYHQEKISANYVANAADAASELHIPVQFMVTTGREGLLAEIEPIAEVLLGRAHPEDMIVSKMLRFGRAHHIEAETLNYRGYVACNGMNVPLVMADGHFFLCCVPPSAGIYPSFLARGSIEKKNLSQMIGNSEADYWLIQALRAGGIDLIAKWAKISDTSDFDNFSICERCVRYWNRRSFYKAAYEIANDCSFQEEVAKILYERGDASVMTRLICTEIFR